MAHAGYFDPFGGFAQLNPMRNPRAIVAGQGCACAARVAAPLAPQRARVVGAVLDAVQ